MDNLLDRLSRWALVLPAAAAAAPKPFHINNYEFSITDDPADADYAPSTSEYSDDDAASWTVDAGDHFIEMASDDLLPCSSRCRRPSHSLSIDVSLSLFGQIAVPLLILLTCILYLHSSPSHVPTVDSLAFVNQDATALADWTSITQQFEKIHRLFGDFSVSHIPLPDAHAMSPHCLFWDAYRQDRYALLAKRYLAEEAAGTYGLKLQSTLDELSWRLKMHKEHIQAVRARGRHLIFGVPPATIHETDVVQEFGVTVDTLLSRVTLLQRDTVKMVDFCSSVDDTVPRHQRLRSLYTEAYRYMASHTLLRKLHHWVYPDLAACSPPNLPAWMQDTYIRLQGFKYQCQVVQQPAREMRTAFEGMRAKLERTMWLIWDFPSGRRMSDDELKMLEEYFVSASDAILGLLEGLQRLSRDLHFNPTRSIDGVDAKIE